MKIALVPESMNVEIFKRDTHLPVKTRRAGNGNRTRISVVCIRLVSQVNQHENALRIAVSQNRFFLRGSFAHCEWIALPLHRMSYLKRLLKTCLPERAVNLVRKSIESLRCLDRLAKDPVGFYRDLAQSF